MNRRKASHSGAHSSHTDNSDSGDDSMGDVEPGFKNKHVGGFKGRTEAITKVSDQASVRCQEVCLLDYDDDCEDCQDCGSLSWFLSGSFARNQPETAARSQEEHVTRSAETGNIRGKSASVFVVEDDDEDEVGSLVCIRDETSLAFPKSKMKYHSTALEEEIESVEGEITDCPSSFIMDGIEQTIVSTSWKVEEGCWPRFCYKNKDPLYFEEKEPINHDIIKCAPPLNSSAEFYKDTIITEYEKLYSQRSMLQKKKTEDTNIPIIKLEDQEERDSLKEVNVKEKPDKMLAQLLLEDEKMATKENEKICPSAATTSTPIEGSVAELLLSRKLQGEGKTDDAGLTKQDSQSSSKTRLSPPTPKISPLKARAVSAMYAENNGNRKMPWIKKDSIESNDMPSSTKNRNGDLIKPNVNIISSPSPSTLIPYPRKQNITNRSGLLMVGSINSKGIFNDARRDSEKYTKSIEVGSKSTDKGKVADELLKMNDKKVGKTVTDNSIKCDQKESKFKSSFGEGAADLKIESLLVVEKNDKKNENISKEPAIIPKSNEFAAKLSKHEDTNLALKELVAKIGVKNGIGLKNIETNPKGMNITSIAMDTGVEIKGGKALTSNPGAKEVAVPVKVIAPTPTYAASTDNELFKAIAAKPTSITPMINANKEIGVMETTADSLAALKGVQTITPAIGSKGKENGTNVVTKK